MLPEALNAHITNALWTTRVESSFVAAVVSKSWYQERKLSAKAERGVSPYLDRTLACTEGRNYSSDFQR
jgi:hypothetical protein